MNNQFEQIAATFKIAVSGYYNAGKTSLINRFVDGTFGE